MQRQPTLPVYSYMYLISASQMLTCRVFQVGFSACGHAGRQASGHVAAHQSRRQLLRSLDAESPTTHLAILGLVVLLVPHLALPLEALPTLHAFLNHALHHVSRVHVHGAKRYQLLAVVLAQWAVDEVNEITAQDQQ